MKQSEPIYLGIDIGGTKVASGLVNGDGDVLYKTRVPMISNRDAATGFAAVRDAIDATLAANPGVTVAGIGICSPGPLDPHTGVVTNPPNLPCWRGFPLADEVVKAYGLPTRSTMTPTLQVSRNRSGERRRAMTRFSMPRLERELAPGSF